VHPLHSLRPFRGGSGRRRGDRRDRPRRECEITSYLEGCVTSELSGNVVDLCPVGALVSKPYSFEARPVGAEEDPVGRRHGCGGQQHHGQCALREVMRVLPRINDEVNEEWIHDKTRHACDGLVRRRLDRPWVRRDGKLQQATWEKRSA
jgi:NADH-quinone oxidoreductase subunit G